MCLATPCVSPQTINPTRACPAASSVGWGHLPPRGPTDARPPPFPWAAALHFGLGLLRLPPLQFWALSVTELLALGGGIRPLPVPDRSMLEALMRQFPDGGKDGR